MPSFNTNAQQGSDSGDWTPFETGQYTMKIVGAKVAPSPFANDDGEFRDELTITWALDDWSDEYETAGYQQGQKVFQRMQPWYGTSKNRGDSKFKQFIDSLLREKLIPQEFWIAGPEDADNQGDLLNIRRCVMVEKYTKTMGKNAGSPGNRVLAQTTLKSANGYRAKPVSLDEAEAAEEATFAKDAPPLEGELSDTELARMGKDELVGIAMATAVEANGFWGKKPESYWLNSHENTLRANIKSMQAGIRRSAADPNVELFPV